MLFYKVMKNYIICKVSYNTTSSDTQHYQTIRNIIFVTFFAMLEIVVFYFFIFGKMVSIKFFFESNF